MRSSVDASPRGHQTAGGLAAAALLLTFGAGVGLHSFGTTATRATGAPAAATNPALPGGPDAATSGLVVQPASYRSSGIQQDPIPNPAQNIPPDPSFPGTCAQYGPSSAACTSAVVAAINNARAQEGVRALTLPSYFATSSPAQQMLFVVNAERTARGLPALVGRSAALDSAAASAAQRNTDPSPAGWTLAGGAQVRLYTGNWASDVNVLAADYDWMYDDGWGGQGGTMNESCTSAGAAGCWGHRENILGDPATSFVVAGTATVNEGAQTSATLLLAWADGSATPLVSTPGSVPPQPASAAALRLAAALGQTFLGTPWQPASVMDRAATALTNGWTSTAQVTQMLADSPQSLHRWVNSAYLSVLGRPADPGGLATFTTLLSHAGSLRVVLAHLAASSEFAQRSQGSAAGFVSALYEVALQRSPSSGEQQHWVGALAAGASRDAVATQIFSSPEALALVVRQAYLDVLGRSADPTGLAASLRYLSNGGHRAGLWASLADSAEYAQRN